MGERVLPVSDSRSRERYVATRDALVRYCDERLLTPAFQDVAVNGLQVAGKADVQRLAVAVSTSRYTLEEAAAWEADALLVHHGLLWGGKLGPITGIVADRLRLLFRHDMSLIAYHLPLDGHPEIGNCALLAHEAGFAPASRFATVGAQPLGVVGQVDAGMTLADLLGRMRDITDREPLAVGAVALHDTFERVGFLTGSGYSAVAEAADAGCQALVTGDIREPTMAEARELGVVVIAAGHEATERFGVQALASELAKRFAIETLFIADPNPV